MVNNVILLFSFSEKSPTASPVIGKAETNIIIIVSVVVVALIVGLLIICWILYKKKSAALVSCEKNDADRATQAYPVLQYAMIISVLKIDLARGCSVMTYCTIYHNSILAANNENRMNRGLYNLLVWHVVKLDRPL